MKHLQGFLSILLLFSCQGSTPEKTKLEGTSLPNFIIQLTDSSQLVTTKIPSGKPFVVLYFSPDCTYCKALIKDITSAFGKLKNIQFYLLTNSSMPEILSFQRQFNLVMYNNITVGYDKNNQIADYFNINSIPYTAIYNKEKKLMKSFLGPIKTAEILDIAEN